jgi:hypothetical protein
VQVNTATLFPGFVTPVCFGVQEITSPSRELNFGLSSGGPRINLSSGGFIIVRTRSGSPTFYIDNPSLSNDAVIRVFGLSN